MRYAMRCIENDVKVHRSTWSEIFAQMQNLKEDEQERKTCVEQASSRERGKLERVPFQKARL